MVRCSRCGDFFEYYYECEKIGKDGEVELVCDNCESGYNPFSEPEYDD
jgi:hypothetical protein